MPLDYISPFKCLRICKRPLSRSLLPQAFNFCLVLTCGWHVTGAIFFYWRVATRQSMPNAKKNLQCWRVADTSNNEISFFGRFFFIFRYNWRVNYTSAIKSFNHLLRFFLIFDVCLTRQWPTFYVFLCCLTCAWHVNDTFSLSLTCGPHVTEANFFYWRVNHTSVHAKCEKMMLDVWSVLHFLSHWRVVHVSLKRNSQFVFRTTDVWMTCQRNHRVTVLVRVWLNSLKTKKFAWKLKPTVS